MSPLSTLVVLALAGAPAPTQVLPAAAIEAQVKADLAERLARVGSAAQLLFDTRLSGQVVPAGAPKIELGEINGRWPRSRVGVPVRLLVDGRLVRSLTVWVDLRDVRTAPTYAEAYGPRSIAQALQIVPARVDMTCCAGTVVGDTIDLAELRLKRSVRAGQPVLVDDFEAMPDVVAQQPVAIEVEQGAVRLTTRGIALRDGRIGERIDVRPDQSNTTVRSRVVAKQKVRVE